MAIDRFLIAPLNSGLQTDLKPFMIADEAFEQLNNAYVFRGRVRKRFGSLLLNGTIEPEYAQLYSRLRINIGTTAPVTGNFGPFVVPGNVFGIGQIFSINSDFYVGDDIFTVVSPLPGPQPTLSTGGVGGATTTYDVANGTVIVTGNGHNANTPVYFYPATPVMGLITYEITPINDEPTFAFDTQFSYFYTAGGWTRLVSTTPGVVTPVWTGIDSQFFWGNTHRGIQSNDNVLFVSNYNAPDRIQTWNGTDWTTFNPIVNNRYRLHTSKIIVSYHDRLVLLNTKEYDENLGIPIAGAITAAGTGNLPATVVAPVGFVFKVGQNFTIGTTTYTINSIAAGWQAMLSTSKVATGDFDVTTRSVRIVGNNENPNTPVYFQPNNVLPGTSAQTYVNRCRFSQNGNPFQADAFRDDVPGKGGFIDCSTQEAIVTAQFVKDRLIVFFEKSTYELVYTHNQVLPFVWQQINTELGAESTFSEVPFDKITIGVGSNGIHACNGSNVERIDNKIPDKVFEINNENFGVERVYGIRDFFTELVYWSYSDPNSHLAGDPAYPTNVLVYNYQNGSWAINDDSITCFGYFQNVNSVTWANSNQTWQESIEKWGSASNLKLFRNIIAGNQEGFTFLIDTESTRNSPSLQITNMTYVGGVITLTIINHNLVLDDWIIIENVQGVTDVNRNIYQVRIVDVNTIQITSVPLPTGVYIGGGTVARVSKIDIYSKQYNFYQSQGRNAYISKIDFNVDKTEHGAITIDYFPSSSNVSMLDEGLITGARLGTGVLETSPYALQPLETAQDYVWHPVFLQADGTSIQLRLYMSDDQMIDKDIVWSDFQLNAIIFYATPTSYRL